jgi:hypothetical protein
MTAIGFFFVVVAWICLQFSDTDTPSLPAVMLALTFGFGLFFTIVGIAIWLWEAMP